jgi:putative DNA primase/helicase
MREYTPGNEQELGERSASQYEQETFEQKRNVNGHDPLASGEIIIEPGKRHQVILSAADTLAKLDYIYQRNSSLVEVIRAIDTRTSTYQRELFARDPEALLLRELTADRAINLLTAHRRWARYNRAGQLRAADFPREHARGLLAEGEWPGIPSLAGIIGAPTIRSDGSLLSQRGHDRQTGLLYASSTEFPRIESEPTKEQALAALRVLMNPFQEFPFASDAARAAHVATILTSLMRRTLPTAPGTVYTAPVMGSGKTLLADSIGLIAHGVTPAHMPFASGRDEFRKLLSAILLAGDPIALIDNIDRPLQSAELCNLLTTDRYGDRVLGETRRVKLDARIMVLATGNNLTLLGDLTRRFLVVEIDPQLERPEDRAEFLIPDLRGYLIEQRGILATAAITLLRAFHVANPPRQVKPLASFEAWSRWVREALIWLGLPDPCDTTVKARDDDPERERLGELLVAWHDKFGSSPKTTAEAIEVAKDSIGGSFLNTPLRAALIEALGSERELEPAALGYYLRRHDHRLVEDFRFERVARRWRVSKCR